MGFINDTGFQHLTNKLVQGDAIKVASHRGHTVKNVIDNIQRECENVATPNTMTLENRVSEFRVGKGRDVDVSGDVEECKIGVSLQGRTYQNLISSFNTIHSTTLNEDDNSVFNIDGVQIEGGGVVWAVKLLKPNTVYTFIFNVEETFNLRWFQTDTHDYYITKDVVHCKRQPGIQAIKITTKDTLTDSMRFKLSVAGNDKTNKFKILKNAILLEGDYTETPIEELPQYFTQIKSSFEDGIVDVEVTGKNLFDGSYTLDMANKRLTTSYIKVEPNTGYICSFNGIVFIRNSLMQYNSNKEQISYSSFPLFFVTSQDTHFVKLQWYNKQGPDLVITEDMIAKANIQLEEGKISTPYEPYYKKKISFNIGEPLRSLPNGVCDEIRNNNGQWELIRRVGKVNASDIQYWNKLATYKKTILYRWTNSRYDAKYKAKPSCSGHCNTIPYYNPKSESDTVFCRINDVGSYGALAVAIEKSKLDSNNPNLAQWFSENPTTVYYELAESVVTQIEPIEFQVKPLATMIINSEIAPISNHTVVLNRAGQIEQGILKIAELRKRVDELETVYENQLIGTQLKLSLLTLDHELEKEEI